VDNEVVRYRPRPADPPAVSALLGSLYDPVFPSCANRAPSGTSAARAAGARRLDA
jgi:hypothetical protein